MLRWADELRRLGVRANADTAEDAGRARELGAEGIGLCRTEHMFFGEDRHEKVVRVILADDDDEPPRRRSTSCCRSSRATSRAIFEAMDGLPVTIRLLDPPLHEFLPRRRAEVERARSSGRRPRELERTLERVARCRRPTRCSARAACRLGILYPEIYEMQVVARSCAPPGGARSGRARRRRSRS